jgi:hypothetical protein
VRITSLTGALLPKQGWGSQHEDPEADEKGLEEIRRFITREQRAVSSNLQWGVKFDATYTRLAAVEPLPDVLSTHLPLPPCLSHVSSVQRQFKLPSHCAQLISHLVLYGIRGATEIMAATATETITMHLLNCGECLNIDPVVYTKTNVTITPTPGGLVLVLMILRPFTLRRLLSAPGSSKMAAAIRLRILKSLDATQTLTRAMITSIMSSQKVDREEGPVQTTGALDILLVNAQVSIARKMIPFDTLLRSHGLPHVVIISEVGNKASSCLVHPAYTVRVGPCHRNSFGLAIAIRRDERIRVMESEFHPVGRVGFVRLAIDGVPFISFGVYLPAYDDTSEITEVLLWIDAALRRHRNEAFAVGGDWNMNPGWVALYPVAATTPSAIVRSFQQAHNLQRIPMTVEYPTWVSPLGFATSIDHVLVSPSLKSMASGRVVVPCLFPSDHFPVVVSIGAITCIPREARETNIARYSAQAMGKPFHQDLFRQGLTHALQKRHWSEMNIEDLHAHISTCILFAADESFGKPVAKPDVPRAVAKLMDVMRKDMLSNPGWAMTIAGVQRIARMRAAVQQAWDLVYLERELGLTPKPKPKDMANKAHYKKYVTLYKRYVRFDAMYSSREPAPPAIQAQITADQVRARHLSATCYATVPMVTEWTGWVARPILLPVITIRILDKVIRKLGTTAPYHDLISHPMIKMMGPEHKLILLAYINQSLREGAANAALRGDFYPLLKKLPHIFVSKTRPIVNMTTLWKLIASCLKVYLQPVFLEQGLIPLTQMALHGSTSALMRVLHDWIWWRWQHGKTAWFLLDDVVHAFGSPTHTILRAALQAGGCAPELVEFIIGAITRLRLCVSHLGQFGLIWASIQAGTGQGDPLAALLFALIAAVRKAIVATVAAPVEGPAGLLLGMEFSDDGTWMGDSEKGLQKIAQGLEKASPYTRCIPDDVKSCVVGASRTGQTVTMRTATVYLNGVALKCAEQKQYIRVVGRYLIPHVFHKEDLIKLLGGCRLGAAPLRVLELPSHFPMGMYQAKGGGIQRAFAHIRPPTDFQISLADHAAAASIRTAGNFPMIPSYNFLGRLKDGKSGIESAYVTINLQFALSHHLHLHHKNSVVRESTRVMFAAFAHRFHPDMACLTTEDSCDIHRDDHSRFMRLLRICGFTVYVPFEWGCWKRHAHAMGACESGSDADIMHRVMDKGADTATDALRLGHWLPPRLMDLERPVNCPPSHLWSATAIRFQLYDLPRGREWIYVLDASWKHNKAGLAVTAINTRSGEVVAHSLPCPSFVDDPFMAETLGAWIFLRSLQATGRVGTGLTVTRGRGTAGDVKLEALNPTFMDCKSYISALGSLNDYGSTSLRDTLVTACRKMADAMELPDPAHLYSHLDHFKDRGRFLDAALDISDLAAKESMECATPSVGWIADLQEPTIAYVVEGIQWHDLQKPLAAQLRRRGACSPSNRGSDMSEIPSKSMKVPGSLAEYVSLVSEGRFQWGIHLKVVAIREGVWWREKGSSCSLCCSPYDGTVHLSTVCVAAPLYFLRHHRLLAIELRRVCPTWTVLYPSYQGVLVVLNGPVLLIRVMGVAAIEDSYSFRCGITVPRVTLGHTGDVGTGVMKHLRRLGLSHISFRIVLRTICYSTIWMHYRRDVPVLPSPQDIRVQRVDGTSVFVPIALRQMDISGCNILCNAPWDANPKTRACWPDFECCCWWAEVFRITTIIYAAPKPRTVIASTQQEVVYIKVPEALQVVRFRPPAGAVPIALIVDAPEAVHRHTRYGEVQWVLEYTGASAKGHVSLLMSNPTRSQRVKCRLWCSLIAATLTMVGLTVRRKYINAFLQMCNM